MPELPKNFGQQLPALESVNPAARQLYERQLQNMLEERLSLAVRCCCVVASVICFVFGIGAAFVVFSEREAHKYWPNLLLGTVVTVTALAIGVMLVIVAARGIYRRQHEGWWAASSGLVMLVTWGLFMLMAACGLPDSLRDMFLTLGLVCLGTAALMSHRLSAAHAQLTLEKRLLELEHRLFEISERLDRRVTP